MRRWASVVAFALAVVSQSVAGSGAQNADFVVRVGASPPDGSAAPFAYTRFYPERLSVHRGQTIRFETVEPLEMHTVAFWPGGDSGRPPLLRGDELPDTFALNEAAWQRSSCGDRGSACVLTSAAAAMSSGLPVFGRQWEVTVDLPAGSTIPFLCQVHAGMTGMIDVVADSVSLPTRSQIDATVRSQVRADTDEAMAYWTARSAGVPRRDENGHRVWTIRIGDTTPSGHVGIVGYVPAALEIAAGDRVEFESAGMTHHSVTFPLDLVGDGEAGVNTRLGFAAIYPTCDLDGHTSGAPGIGGPWAPFSPVECPGDFELTVSPWVASAQPSPDGAVWTAGTFHNSGLMWSEQAPDSQRGRPAGSGRHFPSRFDAAFPLAGVFPFGCTIHKSAMSGVVEVR